MVLFVFEPPDRYPKKQQTEPEQHPGFEEHRAQVQAAGDEVQEVNGLMLFCFGWQLTAVFGSFLVQHFGGVPINNAAMGASSAISHFGLFAATQGGMFGAVFTAAEAVRSYDDVAAADVDRFRAFFHGMLEQGVNLAPSQYEAGFMSIAHSTEDLDQTIAAAEKAFKAL